MQVPLFSNFLQKNFFPDFLKWFTTMDPSTWKTADLEKIFHDEMKIRARPEQPVRAWVQIMVKGAVVFSRYVYFLKILTCLLYKRHPNSAVKSI